MTYNIKPLTWEIGKYDNFPRSAKGVGYDYEILYDVDGTGELEVSFDGQPLYRGLDEKMGQEISQTHHEAQLKRYLTKLNVSEDKS